MTPQHGAVTIEDRRKYGLDVEVTGGMDHGYGRTIKTFGDVPAARQWCERNAEYYELPVGWS